MSFARTPQLPIFYTYVMIDSSTNAPFYVGKGKDDRMRYHEKRVRSGHPLINKHLYHKLKKLLNDNVIILYQKTLSDVEESTAFLEETRLIKEIGRADLGLGPLCNLTDGGDGSAGLKSTLNNLRKRRSMAGINNPMFGMHHSTDSKRVISEKRRRRTTPFRHSMQHRDKLRQFNPGGDKTSKPIVQMNSNGDTVEHWKSIRHAGKTLGIRFGNISNAIKIIPIGRSADIYGDMKPILLKSLLDEAQIGQQNIQCYLDLDGVLVNFDKGFKKIAGGVSAEDFARLKFNGDVKAAKREFWKLIGRAGSNWWANLEMMPDGMVLWNFFKKYNPIILTAGRGSGVKEGKTAWVHKHLGSQINPVLASRGEDKPMYVTNDPNTIHVLIDDTKKNIEAWNNSGEGKVAMLHISAADTIRKFTDTYIKES